MKREIDKRVFLLILIVVFLVVVGTDLFLNKKKTDSEKGETSTHSPGGGLEIETITDGVYLVDGTGTLEGDLLTKQLHKNGILTTDVIHLIIGDGISELGYNCISRFPYLESLKIGAGVSRVRNGAVLSCPKLAWVYLPKSIIRIGEDFLYDCPSATIVLGGTAAGVENAEQYNSIIETVDSFDTLNEYATKQLIMAFDYQSLYSTGKKTNNSSLILEPGETQFGPYASISGGKYSVEVKGEGFSGLNIYDIYIDTDYGCEVTIDNYNISDNRIEYEISIPTNVDSLELGVHNNGKLNLRITKLCIYKVLDKEVPAYLAGWWDAEKWSEKDNSVILTENNISANNVSLGMINESNERIKKYYHPYLSIGAEMLYSDEEQESETIIKLNPGYTQFGPYIPIEKGTYRVVVYGKNLQSLSSDSVFVNPNSWFGATPENIIIEENCILYLFTLVDDCYRLELGINNQTEEHIEIQSIILFKSS